MYQSLFVSTFNSISVVVSIIGTIALFFNPTITVICAIVSVLNSIIQVVWGDQNNLSTEISTVIISAIIALIADIDLLNSICFALCAVEVLLWLLGLLLTLIMYKRRF